MLKPICVRCQRFYRLIKAGVGTLEQMPIVSGAQPGTATPEQWKPYKLWLADLWECKGCGHQIVSGSGLGPVSHHFYIDFEASLKTYGKDVIVNDC